MANTMDSEFIKNDLKSLTRISRSLWGDPRRSIAISEDALSSVTLLNLTDDRVIERASKVMIERAERNPPSLLKLNHPFFRLAPIERFLLTALHLEKWSHHRVARTLGIEMNLVETWAWAIRLKYCFQELEINMDYPRGPAQLGPVCPEYNPSAPWTQRMLDDQLGKRERLFLQSHLMACDRCRKALDSTRKVFFKIEALIPVKDSPDLDSATEQLYETWKEGQILIHPMNYPVGDSFRKFFSLPKVQWVLGGFSFFFFYWITRSGK